MTTQKCGNGIRRAATLASLLLAGCANLPTSGPTTDQVVAGVQSQNPLGLRILPLDFRTIGALNGAGDAALAVFSDSPDFEDTGTIGVGDTLSISIFEAGNSLFAPTSVALSAAQPSGPSGSVSEISLPLEQVDAEGTVEIPYAGRLNAAGRTADQLSNEIEAALAGQSQNPQVIVTDTKPLAETVIISGAVRESGRYPLSLAHERLLDMIAIAGGATDSEQDIYVSLTRGPKTGRILMSDLENDPSQNVYLQPGDRISLNYDPRNFTVFGAAGKVQEMGFESPRLSLAEALARSGGPADGQADPDGVFVFRYETSGTARRLGIGEADQPVPVIYQLDMMKPESYFYAQQFAMRDQDLLYIANAKSNRLGKLINLIGNLVSPAATVNSFARE